MSRGGAGLVLVIAALLFAAGCVTEQVPREPTGQRVGAATPVLDGPVASPATSARTVNARVRVAIDRLGTISYDGQTLPLVAPNGRFVATRTGVAPDWPTVLAGPAQLVPIGGRIEIYDLSGSAPARTGAAAALPDGLLLGRSADDAGFLVEAPREEGARWIGRVDWRSGALKWLVRDDAINAHATLLTGGGLAWARRAVDAPRFALAIRSGPLLGATVVDDETRSMLLPCDWGDDETLVCAALSAGGVDLVTIGLARRSGRAAAITGSRRLVRTRDPGVAFQILAATQTPPPAPGPGAIFFHPRTGAQRQAVLDPRTGDIVLLAPRSSSAAWRGDASRDAGPLFVATHDALVFQDVRRVEAGLDVSPAAEVLDGTFVPRSTTDAGRPVLLLEPSATDAARLELTALRTAE